MITYRYLNKAELKKYIDSAEFADATVIPITYHRAVSHINNPDAEEDDILLILAYDDKKLVGYLGILANRIVTKTARQKCGWFSCLWTDPALRGKGIGNALVTAAIEKWNGKLLITEFTLPAQKLYEKTGAFRFLPEGKGIRMYFRMDLHTILPKKNNSYAKMKGALAVFDASANLFLDARFLFRRKYAATTCAYFSFSDEEAKSFISGHQKDELFRRGEIYFQWMQEYPWILPGKKDLRYHFSSFDKSFAFIPVKLKKQGKLIAVLFFAKRNSAMKLPYAWFEEDALPTVAETILQILHEKRITTFTVFHPLLTAYFSQNRTGALKKKSAVKQYLITELLYAELSPANFFIQDGDGDSSFT